LFYSFHQHSVHLYLVPSFTTKHLQPQSTVTEPQEAGT